MLAVDLLLQFARGVGLSIALLFVIGRGVYRRRKRRAEEEAIKPSDPFGG
jgi:hypothetical protein